MNQDIKQKNWTNDGVAMDTRERNRMSVYQIIRVLRGLQEIHQLTLQLACLCDIVSNFIESRKF